MHMKPLNDYVLVEILEDENQTKSGIIIPDSGKKKSSRGKVLSVGPGKLVNGCRIKPSVFEGDIVLFQEYAGSDFEEGSRKFKALQESDILGITEEGPNHREENCCGDCHCTDHGKTNCDCIEHGNHKHCGPGCDCHGSKHHGQNCDCTEHGNHKHCGAGCNCKPKNK